MTSIKDERPRRMIKLHGRFRKSIFSKWILIAGSLLVTVAYSQVNVSTQHLSSTRDSLTQEILTEIVITASRIPEHILRSPVSIDQLKSSEARSMGAPTVFDAMEYIKGVQVITPSLGFKVINTRGFANTTNVRFAQLIDGIDNQAPHIGAPIANALGANDLDIDKVEIIPGTASALYGINSINGLANIITKSPFIHQGLSVQQLTGVNHVGNVSNSSPQVFSQTNIRFARAINSRFAYKITGSRTAGQDWLADNRTDLASRLNASTNLFGADNPAFDEVNGYGNESPNRRTLTLNGKKYVVARTGYREAEIEDYGINNYKGDVGIYFQPRQDYELSITYKGALINTIYQRSNRFRLQNYALHQYAVNYRSPVFELRSYLTQENTGQSYNLRSLAENMDRAFKPDNQWFTDYTAGFNQAVASGAGVPEAHRLARQASDLGRFEPGSTAYEQKKEELVNINNWDYGAALRVKSYMLHTEGLINWDKLNKSFFEKISAQLMSGFDYRNYIIIPDGNYFINPVDSAENLTYGKVGGFTQLNKDLWNRKLRVSATIRADKADYFDWKFNPRIALVYSPREEINVRMAYQSGYRFPSIFEGFSNVNSGGVRRVGGLRIMSDGIFENSYTRSSIEAFQSQVNSDVNNLGLTQAQAIAANQGILQKNPYTYLQPEHVRSLEFGIRALALKKRLFLDADFYFNSYQNFIAQVEASIPNTNNPDSIPAYLYSRSKQNRYRLWTNSTSQIYNYGGSLGLKYKHSTFFSLIGNITYAKLNRIDDDDGLEDGFNTPQWMLNGTAVAENLWDRLGASITGRYQTEFQYVSFLVSGTVPAYWTVDAQVNYSFGNKGIVAKLGATNLLNKPFYSILGGPSIGGLYYLSLTCHIGD